MISGIIQFFWSCGQSHNQIKYDQLSKKDDELGVAQAQKWKLIHPVPNQSELLSIKKADEKACEIIKNLGKNPPISPANAEIIQSHLVEIAKTDEMLRQKLIDRLSKKFKNNPYISPIIYELVMTCVFR